MKRLKSIFYIIVIICCVYLIFRIEKVINRTRIHTVASELKETVDVPASVTFTTVALGGFRGIFADILWMKALSLQQNGKYFEIAQIASWISYLQPNSVSATAFMAWNLAYNISIVFIDPETKWKWVESAMKLLIRSSRDNPYNMIPDKELAFLFFNKIGPRYDSANIYYKAVIAEEMSKILSSDYTISNAEDMEKAPYSFTYFERTTLNGKKVSDLIKSNQYPDYTSIYNFYRENGKLPNSVIKSIANKEIIRNLSLFTEKELLLNEFGLKPKLIAEVNNKFGPLDWRTFQAFSIYWAYDGILKSKEISQCNSILSGALSDLTDSGKILYFTSKQSGIFISAPDFSSISKINNYFLSKLSSDDKNYINYYYTYLNQIIPLLYTYGKYNEAEFFFNEMNKLYDGSIHKDRTLTDYMKNYLTDYFRNTYPGVILLNINRNILIDYYSKENNNDIDLSSLNKNTEYIYNRYGSTFESNQKIVPFEEYKKTVIKSLGNPDTTITY